MFDANDYADVADIYDAYVRADFDLAFFGNRVAGCAGPVLELMAGTGRVTRAICPANRDLTSIDISVAMLRSLTLSLRDSFPSLNVVCADIRNLPLKSNHFELAIIPFNSFSELTTTRDQRSALGAIRRTLTHEGQLICTLHNPAIRLPSLDGREKSFGSFDLSGDRRLQLWVRGSFDNQAGLARSTQTYRIYDERDELLEERLQSVMFALITREEFEVLAQSEGYQIVELLGDYDGSPFSAGESPYMIWTLETA